MGSVGQALARLLAPKFDVRVASRSGAGEAARLAGGGARACGLAEVARSSDCVVLAVPDRAVPAIAARLAPLGPAAVLQTCGALGPADLSPLPQQGVSCATFHPLQTFPSPEAGVRALPGSMFGVCGSGPAAGWCDALAGAIGGSTVRVEEDRLPLYHAAAVMASNAAVGLVDAALALLELAGIDRSAGCRAIRPLMDASIENARTMGAEHALTGPLMRGDAETVRSHLGALRGCDEPLRELYRAFGRYLLPLAVGRGLAADDAAALEQVLREGR